MSRWQPSATSTASARRSWRSARARARSRAGRRCSQPAASTRCSCARRRCTMRRPRSPRSSTASRSTSRSRSLAPWPTARRSSRPGRRSGTVCAVGYQWRSLDVVASAAHAAWAGRSRACSSAGASGRPKARATTSSRERRGLPTRPSAAACCSSSRATTSISRSRWPVRWSRCRRPPRVDCSHSPAARRARLDDAVSVLLRFAAGGIGACHVAWSTEQSPPLYALDVQAADAALELVLDPVFELRGRARGAEVSCAAASTLASRRSPASWTQRAGAIPPRCPAPPPMHSPPCAPCWPASRQSQAASACRSRASLGVFARVSSLGSFARVWHGQAGPDPTWRGLAPPGGA